MNNYVKLFLGLSLFIFSAASINYEKITKFICPKGYSLEVSQDKKLYAQYCMLETFSDVVIGGKIWIWNKKTKKLLKQKDKKIWSEDDVINLFAELEGEKP